MAGGGAGALWEVARASGGNALVCALVAQLGGERVLRLRMGRQQGALHPYHHSCMLRRCYECPVARLGREEG